jgi:hypothetical protein
MSNQSENLDQGCGGCSQLIPELALGCLDGRERAAALGHIRRCSRCRREFTEYRELADDLLGLVPAVAPPAGFEVRALAAMKAPRPGIPQAGSRRRRGGLLAAAAALVAATLFGGYELGRPGAPIPPLRTVAVMSGGRQVGAAYFYTGSRPFFWVNVWAAGDRVKSVTCELRSAPGRKAVTIGTFPLSLGRGSWGSLLSHRAGSATFIFSSDRQTIATSTVRI